MAARMAEQTDVFRNVFAPGTGRFFDDNGVLYLSEEAVTNMVSRIERSAPLFQALSISPNLTGLSVLADQVAKAVAEGSLAGRADRAVHRCHQDCAGADRRKAS